MSKDPDVGRVLGQYTSEDFAPKAARPHCQFLNRSKINHGLLIDRPNLDASRFNYTLARNHGWRSITQEFSGATLPVDCLLCAEPLLVILRRGVTHLYDRSTGDPLGIYDARTHAQIDAKKVTRFLIYLAARQDEHNYTLLHPDPLQLAMKGVQRGAFLEPGGYLDTLDKAIALHYNGAPPFAFVIPLHTASELRGTGSNASVVTVLTKPDALPDRNALDRLFVGEANLHTLADAYELSRSWQLSDRGNGTTEDAQSASTTSHPI